MPPFLLVTDLDHTLVGNEPALRQLNKLLDQQRATGSKLVYATGRSHRLYKTLAAEANLLKPDVLITSVGAEIYQDGINLDRTWANQLAQDWHAGTVRQVTQQFSQLTPQPASEQCPTKVSCFLAPTDAGILPELKTCLEAQNIRAQVIYSSDRDLDILPHRADKGKALTYVRELLGFAPDRTIACGDSGNDIALFTENTRGIIVGNARSELMRWHQAHPNADRYLAQADCAAGILEGLQHFDFIDKF
jgi:sucrose-6-phosphatase